MSNAFKDYFSDESQAYSQYRPVYPDSLFSYLSSLTEHHDRAWDCATGSGQSAVALSRYYNNVIATDASENQIRNASQNESIIYRHEQAEKSSLENESVDLVTVAQALHWFNLEAFATEVDRVLVPRGVLAVWVYGLHSISPAVDGVIENLYGCVLDAFWPPERKRVEEGYRHIEFPMKPLEAPVFYMAVEWNLSQLAGYLRTWSAVKRYEAKNGVNPVDMKRDELQASWGEAAHKRTIKWPLTLKAWQKIQPGN